MESKAIKLEQSSEELIEQGELSEEQIEALTEFFGGNNPMPTGVGYKLWYTVGNQELRAEFLLVDQTPEYMYIVDVGKTATSTSLSQSTSVTNNAVAVVKFLFDNHNLGHRRLIYRDSDKQIDEIIHDNGVFIRFSPGHPGIENLPELAAYPDGFLSVGVQ